jgi:hypothetical protein
VIDEVRVSRALVNAAIATWTSEGMTPSEINNGSCFEFADGLDHAHDRFESIGIGNLMLYRGKWNDEEYAFDEDLLSKRVHYRPLHGFTWQEMFSSGLFDWPGIHGWAHCRITDLCFDAETPEGTRNPFELSYFAPRWRTMLLARENTRAAAGRPDIVESERR